MKRKLLDKMIDYCLFNQSLSDFVKKYYRALLPFKMYEIQDLWQLAKKYARGLMCL